MSSRNDIGFEIGIRSIRRLCAESDQRMSKAVEVVRRYTRLTIEIRNSGLMALVCGYRCEALFDQPLIPLGFAKFRLLGVVRRSRKCGQEAL
jgi:hypothetical protein